MKFDCKLRLNDIAEGAGVSLSTVSRYYNGITIRQGTKTKIENFLKEHGLEEFIQSQSEGAPAKRKLVGLLTPDLTSYTFNNIAAGACDTAESLGYSLVAMSALSSPNYERGALEQLAKMDLAGLIYAPVSTPDEMPHAQLAAFEDMPVVMVNRRDVLPGRVHVYEDNVTAGYLATKYMLSLGRTNIGFMLGAWEFPFRTDELYEIVKNGASPGGYISLDRLHGYILALEEHGIEFTPSMVTVSGWDSRSATRSAAELLGKAAPKMDGVIACSDLLAAVMMKVLQQHGYVIPGDISVIGWGNGVIADISRPTLTTVEQHSYKMGVCAMQAINQLVNGKPASDIVLKPSVLPRNTTVVKKNI